MVCLNGARGFQSTFWRGFADLAPENVTYDTVFHQVRDVKSNDNQDLFNFTIETVILIDVICILPIIFRGAMLMMDPTFFISLRRLLVVTMPDTANACDDARCDGILMVTL